MRVFVAFIAAALSLLSTVSALAQNFYPIKEQEFLGSVSGLFITGAQYRDPYPQNGVSTLPNSWSMLARWQGNNFVANSVSDDLGTFTAFHVPDPKTTWQRGLQAANAGVQLYGTQVGMLINTWAVPHFEILGGGYNDMYGYYWAEGQRPDAFVRNTGTSIVPSDLVLQANIAVPSFTSWQYANGQWSECAISGQCGDGQVGFFAYLEDRTHALPPIALIGLAYGNRAGGCGGSGGVGFDYAGGVWFGGAGMCTTDITTAITTTPTQNTVFSDPRFFRIHITRQNWTNLINRINSAGPSNLDPALQCTPGATCPPTGYSPSPDDYRLQYAGVIAEASLLEPDGYGNYLRINASGIRQARLGTTVQGMGIYRANGSPPAPATVTALSGGGQAAMLNNSFPYPLYVRVTDAGGNVVPNVTVTFTSPSSGASTTGGPFNVTTNYLGEATYTPQANGVPGTYPVTASVPGATPATFTLTNNTPPTITLSTNGTTFTPSTPVILTASAGDSDGSISQVGFYANVPIAYDYAAPYTASWTAQPGSYRLYAIAWDNNGGYAYSNFVDIVVNPDPSCTTGPVSLDYSGSLLQPNTVTGDIPAYQNWTITFAFTGGAGSQSSFRELYNSYYYPQPDRLIWSVSKCKGDFNGTGACYPGTMYANGGMDVATYASPGSCPIDPDTVYYLNLKVQTCNSGNCGFRMQRMN